MKFAAALANCGNTLAGMAAFLDPFRRSVAGVILTVCLALGHFSIRASDFAFGADLSFLKQAEDRGFVFRDGPNALPGLQIFRNHGYNWIRLRLFVEPVSNNLPNNLQYTIAAAQDAKKLGYKFLLDFHYANSWADPGKQPMPGDWIALSHKQRVKKVFEYTRDSIAAFRDADVLPDMVQVGNEVTHGMLWPEGRLTNHWENFADYLRAGIEGVRSGTGVSPVSFKNGLKRQHTGETPAPLPLIMIHIDTGGSIAKTKYFFDHLNRYKIPFDVIGFSYYPWWQGTLMDLRDNLAFTAKRYQKDIIVVETAYNWRPARETANRVGPFPETPEGQRDFLDELTRIALQTPDQRCKGIFWWEPAVGNRGSLVSRSFFDENGNSLPALTVFDQYTRPIPK
jgi:arabinogalactan endo-1,4-beta-galactosidase